MLTANEVGSAPTCTCLSCSDSCLLPVEGMQSIGMSVCVCLLAYISHVTRVPTKFSVRFTCGRGSVLLRQE